MAQSILSMPIAPVPAHFLGILMFSSQCCKNPTVKLKLCSNTPSRSQRNNEGFLREAASHISVCNKCDFKFIPDVLF